MQGNVLIRMSWRSDSRNSSLDRLQTHILELKLIHERNQMFGLVFDEKSESVTNITLHLLVFTLLTSNAHLTADVGKYRTSLVDIKGSR